MLLHQTALHYYITLYCTALLTLHYTTLHISLHYATLHYTALLHYTTLHCTTNTTSLHYLHCTTHYNILHCTALHCTALHCTQPGLKFCNTGLHHTTQHCMIMLYTVHNILPKNCVTSSTAFCCTSG